MDEQWIVFSSAVKLSYLTKLEQAELWDIMQTEDCMPSLSQAVRMKKLSQIVQLPPEWNYIPFHKIAFKSVTFLQ